MSNNDTTTTSSLRPFEDSDYFTYGGVQDENPEIAEFKWGDVVLDGCNVGGYRYDDANEETFYNQGWLGEFPTVAAARLVAEAIKTPEDLTRFLGEAIH